MYGEKGMSSDDYTDATEDVEITKRANVANLNKAAAIHFEKELEEGGEKE